MKEIIEKLQSLDEDMSNEQMAQIIREAVAELRQLCRDVLGEEVG